MKPTITAFLAALFLLPACSGENDNSTTEASVEVDSESASATLAALVDEYFDRSLELNPLLATMIGEDGYDDRLANSISPEYLAQTEALDTEFLERLLAIDKSALEGQDLLTFGTFQLSREASIEGNQFPAYLQPINQFFSIPNFFVLLGSGASLHPFKTVKNYDDFLSRVDDFVVIMDQAVDNMKIGMQDGIVRPRILMEKVLPQLESQFAESAEASLFWNPVKNMPGDFSDADRERLSAAYKEAIEEKIIPSYKRLHNFIGDEYLGATRETVGLSDLPNGEAWYDFMVRMITTTDLTPDEIHQIGLDEVARIHDETRGVMEEVGFEGDLKEFFEFLNTDDQFYYDEPDQLIDGYRDMSDHISSLAPKLFDVFPKAGFEVRRVEPFREITTVASIDREDLIGQLLYKDSVSWPSEPNVYG